VLGGGVAARAAEAHVGDRGPRGVVAGHPVDAGGDTGEAAGAVAVEHLDRGQRDALGHAVLRAADRAGDVGAVAVAVGVVAIANRVGAPDGAPAEGLVRGPDSGVNDVGADAGAIVGIRIAAVQGQVALVDAVQAPRRRVRLGGGELHGAVLLHVRDRRVGGEGAGGPLAH